MKSLRYMVLMMAVGAACIFPMQAHSQQEVDPDHYDRPAARASAPKLHHAQKVTATRHHQQANRTKIAAQHGGKGQAHSSSS